MIQGEVNAAREATVSLALHPASDGLPLIIVAILDTGFSGYISLQPQQINTLKLPPVNRRSFFLADNQEVDFATYAAIIAWDGIDRGVVAIESNGPPTIGMGLLYSSRLMIDVIDGGEVIITQRWQ
ncbi:MAG: clan AA aspartic protease [Cytophagales bacterium]|nr:clan AA aspartic protease [Armatimonadota bacterium]